METANFDPEQPLSHLERPLQGLRPLAPALSRDRMLFEAGRAAGRDHGRKRWLAATAALASLALCLSGLLSREHTHRQALERSLATRVAEPVPTVLISDQHIYDMINNKFDPTPEASPYSYLALSRRAQSGRLDDWTPIRVDSPTGRGAGHRTAPLRARDSAEALDL